MASRLSRQRTRAVTCSTRRARNASGALSGAAVTLVITGTAGARICDLGQRRAHRLGGRRQQAAVERRADRQQHAAARALRLGQLHRALDRGPARR